MQTGELKSFLTGFKSSDNFHKLSNLQTFREYLYNFDEKYKDLI